MASEKYFVKSTQSNSIKVVHSVRVEITGIVSHAFLAKIP